MKAREVTLVIALVIVCALRAGAQQPYVLYDDFSSSTIDEGLWWIADGTQHVANGSLIMDSTYSGIDALATNVNGVRLAARVRPDVGMGDHVNFHFAVQSTNGKCYTLGLYDSRQSTITQEFVFCQILYEQHVDLFPATWGRTYDLGLEYTTNTILVQVDGNVVHTFDLVPGDDGYRSGARFWLRSGQVSPYGGTITSEVDHVLVRCAYTNLLPTTALRIDTAVELWWQSQLGNVYQPQWCDDLVSSNWSNLGSPLFGSAGEMSTFDSIRSRPAKFYRLLISQ